MKHWWQSKTIWMNGVIAMLLIAESNLQSLQGILPEDTHKVLIFSLPIVNMWLRAITSQGLSFTPKMPKEKVNE